MKNKTVIFILVLGLIASAVSSAYLYFQDLRLVSDLKQAKSDQAVLISAYKGAGTRISVISASQSDDFYNIQASYPQFDGADADFNKKIEDAVKGQLEEFKAAAKENFDARNATMPEGQPVLEKPEQPFDFIATWTPAQLGPRYLSLVFNIYYFSGGAHGSEKIFAFNYDLENKKEITIGDFLGASDNLDKLSKAAQSQVVAQLKASGSWIDSATFKMIQEGTKPAAENYRNFTFGYGKLTVYFEQYQVAPGAAGTVTSVFYADDLEQSGIFFDYLK